MTNNEQQTAVDWLELQIEDLIPNDIGSQLKFKNKIKQAKEMENKQHSATYGNAMRDMINNKIDFQKYYKQTYGGKDGE